MSKELDIAVARALGFRVVKDAANVRGCQIGTAGKNGFDLPYYTDDARQTRLILKEIERRILIDVYVTALLIIVLPESERWDITSEPGGYVDRQMIFTLLCATPEQHCRAFIAVCGQL